MITSGIIKPINNIEKYDNVSYIIDLSKIKCDIKESNEKITISLTKREPEKALF